MAIPPELIERQRATMGSLQTLANRDLLSVWRTLDLSDAQAATALLLPAIRDLTAAYGDAAAVLAADFYDDVRSAAGAPGVFEARAAPVAPSGQVDAMVRWAVTPIWAADPRAGVALTRLAGGTQRLIRKAERDTVFESGKRDAALARWARVPRPDACDFCLMLGSRSDVYDTRTSATGVVGREVRRFDRPGRRGPGRIAGRRGRRGTRHLGEQFHDHCRCDVVPVWSPADLPEINVQLQEEWQQVTDGAVGPEQMRARWRDHVAETRPHQHVTRPG